jgi:sugar phosphate isomerase/epimerase
MKLAITLSTFPAKFGPIVLSGDDLRANITYARGLGYQGLDLFVDNKSEEEIEEICELLNNNEMEVAMFIGIFLAEQGFSLSDIDEDKRRNAVRKYKKQIAVARRLNAKTMPIGFIRGNRYDDESENTYLKRLATSVCELLDFAAQLDITLCLEPINRYEMETFSLETLKILPDLFHMNIEEVSIEKALETAGDSIGHVHVADSNRLAPGQGHVDYQKVLRILTRSGYDGYLSIEAFPVPSGHECAEQGAAYLKPLLGGVR